MRDIVLANPSIHLFFRRPLHSATVYKRMHIPSNSFHRLVGHYIVFERYAISKLQGELRQGGIKYTGVGKFDLRFSTEVVVYLENGTK